MAADVALMDSVRGSGAPVLRFYRWNPPCLSLGRNQPARGAYDLAEIRRRGIDIVRRPTGGRAVLHEDELTYAAVFPALAFGSPRAAYFLINRAIVAGLRQLGVPAVAHAAAPGTAPRPSLSPCFAQPAGGEVTAGGRKLVGSAQWRDGNVVLQHGSLLLRGDQSLLPRLRTGGAAIPDDAAPAPAPAPATLSDWLQPLPSWESLTEALLGGWSAVVGVPFYDSALTAVEEAAACRLSAERFSDPRWIWRV